MTLEEYIKLGKYHKVNIISSYHNHNYLCRHAGGNVKEYIDIARAKGYKVFGVSDHGPLPIEEAKPRMSEEEFYNNYLKQFDEVSSYNDIIIKKGLELEYFKEYLNDFKKYKKYVDYLVLGQHIFYREGKIRSVHYNKMDDEDYILYKKNVIEALETGIFNVLAHPEIVFHNSEIISPMGLKCLEDIIVYCKEKDIPLEINVNGLRRGPLGKVRYRYPRQEYLDLVKKHNAKVFVSDDAHSLDAIQDEMTKITYSYLEDEGFNLLYEIKSI